MTTQGKPERCPTPNICQPCQMNNHRGEPHVNRYGPCECFCASPVLAAAPTLDELLATAQHRVMSAEEKEAQRQSWVRGEMGIDAAERREGTHTTLFPPIKPRAPQAASVPSGKDAARENVTDFIASLRKRCTWFSDQAIGELPPSDPDYKRFDDRDEGDLYLDHILLLFAASQTAALRAERDRREGWYQITAETLNGALARVHELEREISLLRGSLKLLKDLAKASLKLCEWVPDSSKGSSGYIRKERVKKLSRAALKEPR